MLSVTGGRDALIGVMCQWQGVVDGGQVASCLELGGGEVPPRSSTASCPAVPTLHWTSTLSGAQHCP